ncbi:hypothetical protein Q757_04070 [Oenococcus alcoholitolerans]|uniref:Alpha/beta hydrolase n=1 Tax=Oenococcus alcoholitolerans TaxID=931074 RepID=A0ABR4XRI6_9LACO|nr:hypothetical protein Q757_04070 [Oenococcus alcoholitolerans]
MALENYQASDSEKELWIVKDASHAESFWIDPDEYKEHITKFLEKYY